MNKPFRKLGRYAICILTLASAVVAAHAETYALDAGDKLHVRVEDWPSLTGDYAINASRGMMLPVIGEVRVADKSVEQLAQEISAILKERRGLSSLPTTTVEVSAYRSFFIQGDVQKSGDYPFRPNLTVLQAISVAGGFYRAADFSGSRAEHDAIVARGDLQVQTDSVNVLKIRAARLRAERDGVKLELAPIVKMVGDEALAKRFFAANDEELKQRDVEYATQKATIERMIALYEKEIASLRQQIVAENRQLTAINGEAALLAKLTEKGLSNSQRRLTIEQALAQAMAQVQSLETTIVRAEQNILASQERLEGLDIKRRVGIDQELRKIEIDETTAAAKLETARQLVEEIEQLGPSRAGRLKGKKETRTAATITRNHPGTAPVEIEASLSDTLEPGDVVVIERIPTLLGQ